MNTRKLISEFLFIFVVAASAFTVLPAWAQPDITLEYESEFGSSGTEVGKFNGPRAIAVDSENRIIVADRGNHRIQICTDQGECTAFGELGTAPGQFQSPQGVTVDSHGHIIVSDFGDPNDRVQICTYDGDCTAFGGPGEALGKFGGVNGIDVDSRDRIFVVDGPNDRVQICDHEGICTAFGISQPHGLDVDNQGRIIVSSGGTDRGNHTISICDELGSCSSFGGPGDAPGQFNMPFTVEADSTGIIYITENGNNRIQACDYQGGCLVFGEFGTGPGQFDRPTGIALDNQNRLIVGENSDRIQIFRIVDQGFIINAGLNDAWYNPDTDGQGFFITVFPDLGAVSIAWFTYDTELPPMDATANLGDAGHRWMTAAGLYSDNQAVMNIVMTSEGLFDTATDVQRTDPPGSDGTFILTFDSCNSGTVEYDIPSISMKGIVPIQRIANDNIALCEALSLD